MRAFKNSILFFAAVMIGITAANTSSAQCPDPNGNGMIPCNATVQRSAAETVHIKTVYPRRASHNSKDQIYKERKVQVRPAPVVQTAYVGGDPSILKDKDGSMFGGDCSRNTKDGSMFGGDCSRNTKDGSMFGGSCSIPRGQCFKACKQNCGSPFTRSCEQSCKPCFSCAQAPVVEPTTYECKGDDCAESMMYEEKTYRSGFIQNYVNAEEEIYDAIHKCKDLAPLELKYVDFRIKKDRKFTGFSNRLGNYRFRIFGCRRFDKHAMLNQGRIVQKDLQFIRIFDDMVSDCYNVVKTPTDLCLPENRKPLPEYVLTAEITDYFMNICDKYDWDDARKEELRTGSSEMTVTWRLTDVTGTTVLWKGESTGYAEIDEGEYNGEVVLIERAFADAVNSLRNLPGFNDQLSKRHTQEEMAAKRQQLVEVERVTNPVKCQYQDEIRIAQEQKDCGIRTICQDIDTCTGEVVKEVIREKEVVLGIESSGQLSKGDFVSEDGGSSSTASISDRKVTLDENAGHTSSGSGGMEETITTSKTEIVIDENSGHSSSGSGGMEEASQTTMTDTMIDEASGFTESGSGGMDDASKSAFADGFIDENSGIYSSGSGNLDDNITFEVVDSIYENSGVLSAGAAFDDELWIDVPLDSDSSETSKGVRDNAEQGFAENADSLCIIDRPPYETLSPENVYKMRASVVSITNVDGKKGSGLIVSNQFILTSADLVTRNRNYYDIETINGLKLKATAFRVNPNKNIALMLLDEKTKYSPLPLNLDLPPIGKNGFLTLGLVDFDTAEGRLQDRTKVVGYRYSDEKGAEIVVSTNVQKTSVGGALIDENGTINGIAHTEKTTTDNNDLFIPITNAIKSVGLSICDKPFPTQTPWYERSTTPLSEAIDNYKAPKAPEAMKEKERK